MPEDTRMGFGVPNAALAVANMLGVVRNKPVINRVTPLFGLHSAGGRDYAAVATPQLAMALTLYSTNAYVGSGSLIPGYSAFPNTAAEQPRARALILTTEGVLYQPAPVPIPLYLLERKRPGAVLCNSTTDPRCYGDFILRSSTVQVESAIAAGYGYAGLQGYVYGACSPEPACMPTGTQKLHPKCHTANQDCAVFLEHERSAFESLGFTAGFQGSGNTVLGYAYPVVDSDGDTLPDGLEYVIGTSPNDTNSDDDGLSDAAEYPFASVPLSDPCSGPMIRCLRGIDSIFQNGFE